MRIYNPPSISRNPTIIIEYLETKKEETNLEKCKKCKKNVKKC